ncbi:hypothetical protein [Paenarthrobacter sp. NPDC058040]|uniref:hypothetical protein n=1 Tax=unclassified Paenarthrobacter TaxID=2634190 RepID=UPI0036DA14B0
MSATPTAVNAPQSVRSTLIPVVAYSLIFTLLFFIPNLLPIYTGILIDIGGLGPEQAGAVNSTYLGSMTVATISATFLVSRIPPRTLAFAAILLQAVGFGIPLLLGGGEAVFLGMAVAGLGNGALFAVTNASGALEKHPVLVFGAGMVLTNVASAALPTPLYAAVGAFGLSGLFITPLAVIPLILFSLLVLPRKVVTEVAGTERQLRRTTSKSNVTAVLLLAGIFLSGLFTMVYYAYSDRLLVRAGFQMDAIALIFTVIYLTASLGGVVAMMMARWPKHLAVNLVVITSLLVLSVVLTTVFEGPTGVVIGANVAGALSMLTMAIQPALAAQLDLTGRLSAAASGALIASMALGPIIGGWILESFGFRGITILTIVLGVGAVLAMGAVYLRHKTLMTKDKSTIPTFS